MRAWIVGVTVATTLAIAVALPHAAAGEIVYHSGTIEAVDAGAGRLSLAEVGPWRVARGRTVTTRVVMIVSAATEVVLALRAEELPDEDFAGTFVYAPLETRDLAVGDYVTVECEHRDAVAIARRIVVSLDD